MSWSVKSRETRESRVSGRYVNVTVWQDSDTGETRREYAAADVEVSDDDAAATTTEGKTMRYTMSNGAEVTTRAMSEDDGAHREVMLSGEVIGWLYGERDGVWYGETRNGEPIMAATSYGVAREVYRRWTGNDVKVTRVDDVADACETCEQVHADYPHVVGYLVDCDACRADCHCDDDVALGHNTPCVWDGHDGGRDACEVCGRPATDSLCDVNGMPDGVQVWVDVCDDDACRNAVTAL